MSKAQIKTLEDLRSYLWEELGYVNMATVDDILDVIKKHQCLLKEHPRTNDVARGVKP